MAEEGGQWTPWSGRAPSLQEMEDYFDWLDRTPYGRRMAEAEQRTYAAQEREFAEGSRRFDASHSLASQSAAATRAYQQGQLANERKRIELEAKRIEIERGRAAADEFRMKAELGLGLLDRQVELRSTPDNYWKLRDLDAGLAGRAFVPEVLASALAGGGVRAWGAPGGVPTPQDLNTVVPAMTGGQPLPSATMPSPFLNQPNTFEGGLPAAAPQVQGFQMAGDPTATPSPGTRAYNDGGQTPQGAASGTPASGGSGSPQQKDFRQAAIAAILKTAAPSGTEGWDANDVNALKAIGALYAAGGHKVTGGTFESWDPTTISLVRAGGKRLGYAGNELFDQWARSRPVMGSALEAA